MMKLNQPRTIHPPLSIFFKNKWNEFQPHNIIGTLRM